MKLGYFVIPALISIAFLTGCKSQNANSQAGGPLDGQLTEGDLSNGNLKRWVAAARGVTTTVEENSGTSVENAPFPAGMNFGSSFFGGPTAPNDPGSSYDTYLDGSHEGLVMMSGYPIVEYGQVQVGQTSVRKVMVANFGTKSVLLAALSIDVTPGEYQLLSTTCEPILAAFDVCSFDVTYTPAQVGVDRAKLRLVYLTKSGAIRAAYRSFSAEGVIQAPPTPAPTQEPEEPKFIRLGMGELHTCAILKDDRMKCWGYNRSGALGINSLADSNVPADVVGVGAEVESVDGGYRHTCAIIAGALKCTGNNVWGELGDNGLFTKKIFSPVYGMSTGVTHVATSHIHGCAVQNGGAKCWGHNGSGQLGDNTHTLRRTPVPVYGLGNGITQVATGAGHSCALTDAGGVLCWGANGTGQLGDNSNDLRKTPVPVYGLDQGVKSIYANNDTTCAIKANDELVCWGKGNHGQLGTNSTADSRAPIAVYGIGATVTDVAIGENHACAIVNGGLKCWGYNLFGQLGNGTTNRSLIPRDVAGATTGVTKVAAAHHQTCFVQNDRVKCMGRNNQGQLGNNSTTNYHSPFEVYPAYLY